MATTERGVRRGLEQTQLPYLQFVGEETLTGLQGSTALTIPLDASCVEISAESGAVYWTFSAIASATSGGYIPEDGARWIGPMCRADLQTRGIRVFSSGTVHVMYFMEN